MHTHAFGREHHAACAHDYSVPDLGDMTYSLCDLLQEFTGFDTLRKIFLDTRHFVRHGLE
jgi:hypothetical protein